MTTQTPGRASRNRGKKFSYEQVLEAARSLTLREQRRLREELAKTEQVYLAKPNSSDEAIQQGRQMAEEVRTQIPEGDVTLDETISKLRGR